MLVDLPLRRRVNLHIFPATAPEPLRHLLFRDWLRTHEASPLRRREAPARQDDP
ncbi:GrpB family protein [Leekyejoonella antrihumi]|uniref:GrpB family protein n=1 Tax=Leekyejoonella antrihumi TaxID=1660198 RepID=A0A563E408_9MICO|nr:GrpB family protein [Leekyejoonella antrihumi]